MQGLRSDELKRLLTCLVVSGWLFGCHQMIQVAPDDASVSDAPVADNRVADDGANTPPWYRQSTPWLGEELSFAVDTPPSGSLDAPALYRLSTGELVFSARERTTNGGELLLATARDSGWSDPVVVAPANVGTQGGVFGGIDRLFWIENNATLRSTTVLRQSNTLLLTPSDLGSVPASGRLEDRRLWADQQSVITPKMRCDTTGRCRILGAAPAGEPEAFHNNVLATVDGTTLRISARDGANWREQLTGTLPSQCNKMTLAMSRNGDRGLIVCGEIRELDHSMSTATLHVHVRLFSGASEPGWRTGWNEIETRQVSLSGYTEFPFELRVGWEGIADRFFVASSVLEQERGYYTNLHTVSSSDTAALDRTLPGVTQVAFWEETSGQVLAALLRAAGTGTTVDVLNLSTGATVVSGALGKRNVDNIRATRLFGDLYVGAGNVSRASVFRVHESGAPEPLFSLEESILDLVEFREHLIVVSRRLSNGSRQIHTLRSFDPRTGAMQILRRPSQEPFQFSVRRMGDELVLFEYNDDGIVAQRLSADLAILDRTPLRQSRNFGIESCSEHACILSFFDTNARFDSPRVHVRLEDLRFTATDLSPGHLYSCFDLRDNRRYDRAYGCSANGTSHMFLPSGRSFNCFDDPRAPGEHCLLGAHPQAVLRNGDELLVEPRMSASGMRTRTLVRLFSSAGDEREPQVIPHHVTPTEPAHVEGGLYFVPYTRTDVVTATTRAFGRYVYFPDAPTP